MMFELRPYQRELIDRVQGAWADGFQAPCVVLPCGGGKSVMVQGTFHANAVEIEAALRQILL